jgi:diacylglycerol kinase (ATP)
VKRIAVILNGISRRKKFFYHNWLPLVGSAFDVVVFETGYHGHAIELTNSILEKDFDLLVAAGGDGTLSQIVNGIATADLFSKIPVTLLPLGSGNDFAKTLGVSSDPRRFVEIVRANRIRQVNIGQIDYTRFNGAAGRSFFINVADVGMGPEVVRRAGKLNNRVMGATVNYYKSILATFLSYKPVIVHAEEINWKWSGVTRSLAVANGKFYGHGLCVAPDADPADDRLDVLICGDVSVFDFIRFSGKMKKGEHVPLEEVRYKVATRLRLRSETTCLIEGDGDVLGVLPASISLRPEKILMLTP